MDDVSVRCQGHGRFKKVSFEVGELAAKISGETDDVRGEQAIWVRLEASGPD